MSSPDLLSFVFGMAVGFILTFQVWSIVHDVLMERMIVKIIRAYSGWVSGPEEK